MLLFVFVSVARSARAKEDAPLAVAWADLKPRLPLFLWCIVGWPLFLSASTTIKSAMPALVGFHLDPFLTQLDAAIFGEDPWRIAHAIVGPFGYPMGLVYHPVWGTLLGYSIGLAAAFASRERATTLILSMCLTIIVGGCVLAYALSSVGPILAHIVDPELGARFAPLHQSFEGDPIAPFVANYLESTMGQSVRASGISAMPSIHVAVCMLYVLACRGTWLFWPSVVFAVLIYVGSVYSGLHYSTDGVVGAAVAVLCWYAAKAWIERPTREPASMIEPAYGK